MSEEKQSGPVDTGAQQVDIAAKIEAEAAEKAKVDEPAKDAAEALEAVEQAEADVQEHSEDSADSDGDDATAKRTGKKPGVHNRIDQLTREKYENARRAEAAERQLQEIQAQMAQFQGQQSQQQPEGQQPEATLEDFNYDWNAFLAYREQRMQENVYRQFEEAQRQQEQVRQQQEVVNSFRGRVSAFEAANPGAWAFVESAPVALTQAMESVLLTSEKGPEIAHYLATNLDEADAISRNPDPMAQVFALARIESGLAAPKPAPQQHRPVSNAPAPVKTLSADAPVRKDVEEMSMAEYAAHRQAQRIPR